MFRRYPKEAKRHEKRGTSRLAEDLYDGEMRLRGSRMTKDSLASE